MPKVCYIYFFVLAFAVAFASSSFAKNNYHIGPKKNLFKIKKIQIKGLKKVEKEAILEKIGAKVGMVLDNQLLKRDLDKIYGFKYFDYVEAHSDKLGTLTFIVKEKPIISEVIIKGNDDLDEDDLVTQIKTKKFSILDVNTIKSDIVALQKYYEEKGYFLASVTYRLQKINAENMRLTFSIKEYDKVKVKKVIFLGNKAFKDDQLKGIMETREESVFGFMSNAGNFKEFNFQTDIERIKFFYKSKGYLQVNVGTPQITVSEDKRWVFVTVKINEGPQFSINEIFFQGEVLFSEEKLRESINLKEEEIYSEQTLQRDIQKLTEMYQDKGYAFANVLRTLNIVPGENKVDVEFSFEKGKIVYFGKIIVKGNTKTRDKVIRRELLIREGRQFSGSDLRRSKENVNRLGFFEPKSVLFNTVTPKGKDDVLDVEISVKERNTGQITLGAGYSTASGAFMQSSIAQNNFNGLGQNLSFSLSLSSTNKDFNLGFTEPYFMDSKWTAGADIFKKSNSASSAYSFKRKGFDFRVGHPIYDYTRLFFTYKFEDTEISDVEDFTIKTSVENGVASSVTTTLITDKRNNKFEPTKGFYARTSLEFAGVGGKKKWLRYDVEGRYYYTLIGDLVFRSKLFVGKMNKVNSQRIPRTEKYILGGSRNLRGYRYEGIGPTITESKNGVFKTYNTGGLFSIYSAFELEHPLAREAGLKWVVFFDAGNIYDKYIGERNYYAFKMDYGFGIRWFSPIGVLRFEYGLPINPDKKKGSEFHFDIGQFF